MSDIFTPSISRSTLIDMQSTLSPSHWAYPIIQDNLSMFDRIGQLERLKSTACLELIKPEVEHEKPEIVHETKPDTVTEPVPTVDTHKQIERQHSAGQRPEYKRSKAKLNTLPYLGNNKDREESKVKLPVDPNATSGKSPLYRSGVLVKEIKSERKYII